MKKHDNLQSFSMEDHVLRFDPYTSMILCLSRKENKKVWIKKLFDLSFIIHIIEDKNRYYLSCGSGETSGQFIAVKKSNGESDWFIPGRSFLSLIYGDFLYLIFNDEENRFYLIKAGISDGKSLWHYPVEDDLCEYEFKQEKLKLKYYSGRFEELSINTGRPDSE